MIGTTIDTIIMIAKLEALTKSIYVFRFTLKIVGDKHPPCLTPLLILCLIDIERIYT